MPPGDGPLLEVGVVAAVVDRDLALGEVELDDPGDAAGQELPVVGDQHDAGAQPADERLQPLEPGEVEVVGGLVEQHHVEAAQQQRGEGRTSGLTAGERGHQGVRVDVETELGQHRREPVVEVRRAARQPVVERDGVRVVGGPGSSDRAPRRPPPSPRSRGWHPCDGRGSRRSSRRRRARAPAGASRRRRPRVRSTRRRPSASRLAGEQSQQRRLAGAVGPDDPHHVARGDGEVEGLEEGARPVATGQVLRHEGAGHAPRVVRRSVG